MRLLFDEHFSPRIAERLRADGHDVTAVARSEMAGLSDRRLVAEARDQGRALVTADASDFVAIAVELAHVGAHHAGIILANRRRFPPSGDGIGLLAEALDALLVEHRDSEALTDRVVWLDSAPG